MFSIFPVLFYPIKRSKQMHASFVYQATDPNARKFISSLSVRADLPKDVRQLNVAGAAKPTEIAVVGLSPQHVHGGSGHYVSMVPYAVELEHVPSWAKCAVFRIYVVRIEDGRRSRKWPERTRATLQTSAINVVRTMNKWIANKPPTLPWGSAPTLGGENFERYIVWIDNAVAYYDNLLPLADALTENR